MLRLGSNLMRQGAKLGITGVALALLIGLAAAAFHWHRSPFTALSVTPEKLQCAFAAESDTAVDQSMVWVPPGELEMGDTVYPEEQPLKRVQLNGFWMDRHEVTNAEFARFVLATGYVTVAERPVDTAQHPGLTPDMQKPGAVVFVMPTDVRAGGDLRQWWRYLPGANWRHPGGPQTDVQGRGAFPVVSVTYEDAVAYASWKGRELPTEDQWEWAARAGGARAQQDHAQPQQANTWQGLFPVINSADDGFAGVAPVGCYAANSWGLHDMIGNVWELTRSPFVANHRSARPPLEPGQPPVLRPPAGLSLVIKGGSFLCAPNYCMRYRAGARQPQEADLASSHVGFRTVKPGTAPATPAPYKPSAVQQP